MEEGIQAAAEQAVLKPNDLDAHELYIDLLLNAGFQEQARRTYSQRVQLNPLDANAHYLLGRATVDARAARSAGARLASWHIAAADQCKQAAIGTEA